MRCFKLPAGLRSLVLLLLLNGLVVASARAEFPSSVPVTGGTVAGVRTNELTVFKGIPFAAPPVGPLRWRSPQPVVPWTGVRPAEEFGPSPQQNPFVALMLGVPQKFSEDCLYLNVWTPATNRTAKLPVMVWIYGGAFSSGSTAVPLYDGAKLATRGVVVVSVAYRVGVFGFLAHPELTRAGEKGNFGLRDQIAGLEWVRANIAGFGGDPAQITIFGESAGGESVSLLVNCPRAKGLFHRAIAESGALFAPPKRAAEAGHLSPTLALAELAGAKLFADLGATNLAAARALSTAQVMRAAFTGWPCVEDELLPADPHGHFQAGRANETPILVGFNSDDGAMFVPGGRRESDFVDYVRNGFGDQAETVLGLYPHAGRDEAGRSAKDLVRDLIFAWPAWCWAGLQAERNHHPAYVYYFDYPSRNRTGGAGHAAELAYVFGHVGHPNPVQAELSRLMGGYWVNFAKTGDPNGPGLPPWHPFRAAAPAVLHFTDQTAMAPAPNQPQMRALDAYFAWRRQTAATGARNAQAGR